MTKDFSQTQKILYLMCKNQDKDWWLPADFMHDRLGKMFVGYEASARLSELAKSYPEMVESKNAGKYIARRLRFEDMHQWVQILPKHYRQVFHITGLTKELPKADPPEPPKEIKRRNFKLRLKYVGRTYSPQGYQTGQVYELKVSKLEFGKPVSIIEPTPRSYGGVGEFYKDWQMVVA